MPEKSPIEEDTKMARMCSFQLIIRAGLELVKSVKKGEKKKEESLSVESLSVNPGFNQAWIYR